MEAASNQLEAARLALAKCETQGLALASSISDSRWRSRTARGGWSPAQCFAHLNLTTSAMLPLLQAGAQEACDNQWTAKGPLGVGLLARMLCWALEPPYRIKTATLPVFMPSEAVARTEMPIAWKDGHEALDKLIRDSAGLALDRPLIVSPFDPKRKLCYSVYAALLILAAHERRHLWQARRAAEEA